MQFDFLRFYICYRYCYCRCNSCVRWNIRKLCGCSTIHALHCIRFGNLLCLPSVLFDFFSLRSFFFALFRSFIVCCHIAHTQAHAFSNCFSNSRHKFMQLHLINMNSILRSSNVVNGVSSSFLTDLYDELKHFMGNLVLLKRITRVCV